MGESIGRQTPFLRKRTLILMGLAAGITVICFTALALLPALEEPMFKSPLRSFLTGLGVAGVAFPLYALGFALKRKFASSPYFEGAFIAAGFNLAGFVCAAAALACIGFGLYDVVLWLLR